MAKKKKSPPLIRYILRISEYKEPNKSGREHATQKKTAKGLYSTIYTRGPHLDRKGKKIPGFTLNKKARVVNSLTEARAIVKEEARKFKKQSKYKDFAFNIQAFSGKVSRAKNKLYLSPSAEASHAFSSRNIKKKFTETETNNAITEAFRGVEMAVKRQDYSDTVRRNKTGRRTVTPIIEKKTSKGQRNVSLELLEELKGREERMQAARERAKREFAEIRASVKRIDKRKRK